MKIKKFLFAFAVLVVAAATFYGTQVYAAASQADDGVISNGVYINDMDMSGMTKDQATQTVETYVSTLGQETLTLMVGDNPVKVKAEDLGLSWKNTEVVKKALELGKVGNIIQRYKASKDLENEPKKYKLTFDVDKSEIQKVIEAKCTKFDVKPEDASIKRSGSTFVVTAGKTGLGISVPESVDAVYKYMTENWDLNAASIDLSVETTEPKVTSDDLKKIKDVLGSFTTSYSTSSSSRSANVANGARLVNGSVLMPGETFSTYKTITPFSAANGYYLAGSYLQGQVVDTFGGGICQVSTTLYNAVLRAELEVVERHNHSMIVTYVDPSADAAISESAGKDFQFKNTTNDPIYIEGITSNKKITFNIYGVETRDSNHSVKYVSQVLSTKEPQGVKYVADPGLPFGVQKKTQSAHTGYTAKLFKHVFESGKEVSVEEVNSSTYKAEPAYISVGTANGDEASVAALTAAIATGDPAAITNTINSCAGAIAAANAAAAQAAADAAAAQAATDAAAAQAAADAAAAQAAADAAAAQAAADAAAAQTPSAETSQ